MSVHTIYRIHNTVNGKSYVGQTIQLEKRIQAHFGSLTYGKHVNMQLQADFRQYGRDAFVVETLEVVEQDEANAKEIFWMAQLNSRAAGYNVRPGGKNPHIMIYSQDYYEIEKQADKLMSKWRKKGEKIRQIEAERTELYEQAKQLEALKRQIFRRDNP